MGINTPNNDELDIKTMEDIKSKMCPELQLGKKYVQPYLIERFLTIYDSLKSGEQQLNDDILKELNMIWEAHLAHKNLMHEALVGARAAIMTRNLSHNPNESLIFPNKQFEKFLSFCNVGEIENKTLCTNKFETLLQKDAEKLKNNELNKIYVQLRQEGKTPIEAIKELPWGNILMNNMLYRELTLPNNDDIFERSRMGNTDYCLGRTNIIIGIIVLNEGTDYLNEHFKYADVLRDGVEDTLQSIPKEQRDNGYLSEYLGIEDPHQILIYIDDDGSEQDIDTNQIGLKQLGYSIPCLKNTTKTYEGKMSEIAYEIYFLNYINTYFNNLEPSEQKELASYIEFCNKKYGLSYTITKRLLNFAIQMNSPEKEDEIFGKIKELSDEYPCIKDTMAYQMKLNESNIDKINEFIHKKYGPQFNFSHVLRILGTE